MTPMTKLDEGTPRMQTQHRDAAPLRLRHYRPGRGTVAQPLRDADDFLFQLGGEVEVRLTLIDKVIEQPCSE